MVNVLLSESPEKGVKPQQGKGQSICLFQYQTSPLCSLSSVMEHNK